MMFDFITPILISLVGGAVGGNVAGLLLKNLSLGTVGNSVAGLVGGLGGAPILGPALLSALGPVAASTTSSAVGGSALVAIVGLIRSFMRK